MGPCDGPCPNPVPVNFQFSVTAERLSRAIPARISAVTDDAVPVKTKYRGVARFGRGDARREIPVTAAREVFRGTAGAPRRIRIRLTRAQRDRDPRQARRAGRRSVLMKVRLRGRVKQTGRPVGNDFVFRLLLR
jgi:hypothetical protein